MTCNPVCIWGSRPIPVCIQGSQRSSFAYVDHMALIFVCIRGFAQSPYAYGDFSVTNRMHTRNISILEIKTCIPMCVILHTGIAVCIWGSPYANGRGSLKKSQMGICYARFPKNGLYIIGTRLYIIGFFLYIKFRKKCQNFPPFIHNPTPMFPPFLYIIRPRLYIKRIFAFVLFIYNPNYFIYNQNLIIYIRGQIVYNLSQIIENDSCPLFQGFPPFYT
jgi:hypothetical protein